MRKRHRRINKNRLAAVLTALILAVLVLVRGCAEIRHREETAPETGAAVSVKETPIPEEETPDPEEQAYPTMETLSGDVLAYTDCLTVEATAYSGGGKTAMGTAAGEGTVAVDPDVIPLGSRLYITAEDGSSWVYGYAVAEDTGGSIQGERVDLFFWSESDCRAFGRRTAKVYVLAP